MNPSYNIMFIINKVLRTSGTGYRLNGLKELTQTHNIIATMALKGRSSSALYAHTTQTSTIFVKKSIKLHSVACQLPKKKVHVAFIISFQLYTQKKYYSRIH